MESNRGWAIGALVGIVLAAAGAAGMWYLNSSSPSERDVLAERGIPFTEERFLQSLREHDAETAKLFVGAGIDPGTSDEAGKSALGWAAMMGDVELMTLLLERGADPGHRDNGHLTPLYDAVLTGHVEAARLLIENGARVDPNPGETSPLMFACSKGHGEKLEMVDLLIEAGADVDARDTMGRTPLMFAAGKIRFETVKRLVEAGADVTARDQDGRSVLFFLGGKAERESRDPIVEYLEHKGATE